MLFFVLYGIPSVIIVKIEEEGDKIDTRSNFWLLKFILRGEIMEMIISFNR